MKNKGISLIVLIITIVVIIILATAIIVNLADTNIIDNANEAVVKQDITTFQEELDLYIADQFVINKGKFDSANVNASTVEELVAIIPSVEKSKYKEDLVIVGGEILVKSTMSEPQKTWAMEVLNQEKYQSVAVNTKVEGKNATITGKNPTYNNPVIPVGFKAVNYGASWGLKNGIVEGWNDGLVIVDESGNEYVWVPVDGTNVKYMKNYTYASDYGATPDNTSDDSKAIPVSNENTQILKYGGFYIARYEAGVPENQSIINGVDATTSNTSGVPVVKQGATLWTKIDYNNASGNAKTLVNNSKVKSGLITGTAWDTVCAWISSEKDSNGNSKYDVTNSVTWGNYSDSDEPANVDGFGEKQVAGFSDNWKAKNIYDLAGNMYEWTTEMYTDKTNERVRRGGRFSYSGATDGRPVTFRNSCDMSETREYKSFRIILYVM